MARKARSAFAGGTNGGIARMIDTVDNFMENRQGSGSGKGKAPAVTPNMVKRTAAKEVVEQTVKDRMARRNPKPPKGIRCPSGFAAGSRNGPRNGTGPRAQIGRCPNGMTGTEVVVKR